MGCARMSIEFTIPSPKIQTSIENDAEVVVDVLDGDAKMSCDVQQCDAEVTLRQLWHRKFYIGSR